MIHNKISALTFLLVSGVLYLCSKECVEESKSWRFSHPKENKE